MSNSLPENNTNTNSSVIELSEIDFINLDKIATEVNSIESLIKYHDINLVNLEKFLIEYEFINACLLYTSPSPRDATLSRMPSSA